MKIEAGGDNCTGRDAPNCTDEELSKGSIRDGVLGRDEGYGAFIPSTCLARMNRRDFVITEKALNFWLPVL